MRFPVRVQVGQNPNDARSMQPPYPIYGMWGRPHQNISNTATS